MTAATDLIQSRLAREAIAHAALKAAERQRDEARRSELRGLAEAVTNGCSEMSPGDIQAQVAALIHPSLSRKTAVRAWKGLTVAVREYAEIDAMGSDTPGVSKEELLDWLEGDREAALNVLVNGTGGNRT